MMSATTTHVMQYWPTAQLLPYANNARTHSTEQVAQIVHSINAFGFVNPILVGDDNVVVAGHGRLLAAQQLGLAQVPVIELSHLTPTQRRALALADNRIADNAGWDEALLQQELAALDALDIDLENLGFLEDELQTMLRDIDHWEASNSEHSIDHIDADNDCPEPHADTPAISQLGDLWQLGGHRLLCGDATDRDAIDQLMAGDQAQMVFTDPPYNVNYRGSLQQQREQSIRPLCNDNLQHDYAQFIERAMVNLLAVTDGACYIALATSEIDTVKRVFESAGGHWSTFIIWAKNHFTLSKSDYQRQFEAILYGWPKGSKRHWCGDRNQSDVWHINKPPRNDLHPTMKPIELVERAVRNSSQAGDIVLDPFAGSGTTLIACEQTHRQARLMEIDPHYVDVIIRRWQQHTGQQAIRASDSQAFDRIADHTQGDRP